MTARRQQVVVRLTMHQALRMERMGECLWPTEKLTVAEISRRLLLEHLGSRPVATASRRVRPG
jgi:hypothetical protein